MSSDKHEHEHESKGYSRESDDEKLAQAASAGSIEARNTLYLRQQAFYKQLAAPARRFLGTAALIRSGCLSIEPADIDQQTFLAYCNLLAAWCPEDCQFDEFIRRKLPGILVSYVRAMLDYRRRRPLNIRLGHADHEAQSESAEAQTDAEAAASLAWSNRVRGLSSALRQTVQLRYRNDLSSEQIAVVRGLTKRTVDRNLRTAHAIIRKKVEDNWEQCG